MFKVEITTNPLSISIETSSISDEKMVRKLIDDITKKYTTQKGLGNADFNAVQLSA